MDEIKDIIDLEKFRKLLVKPDAEVDRWREEFYKAQHAEIIRASGLPAEALCRTFENFDQAQNSEAFGTVAEWAQHPAGWVFLHGSLGSGKTHLAAAALQRIAMLNIGIRFLSYHAIDRLQYNEIDGVINSWALCLDDLGFGASSDRCLNFLYSIIDSRYLANRPTILTANMSPAEMFLRGDLWARIADRIHERAAGRIVKMEGRSRR